MGAGLGAALGRVAVADVLVQLACFVVAAALKTEKFFDVSASLTYLLCIWTSLRRNKDTSPRQRVNSSLVVLWALRLGSFLLWRVLKDGGDSRFNKVRDRPSVFFIYWAVQALWIFLTALPVYIVNSKRGSGHKASEPNGKPRGEPLGWRDHLGWALWALGFAIQVTADVQKTLFKADPANAGRWINTGLWRLAQHPNYFGEMAMWWGIFLSCSSELAGAELLSVVSPAFVTHLLLNVSGAPLLRKAGLRRWGHLPEFREYLARTPLLVPLPRGLSGAP